MIRWTYCADSRQGGRHYQEDDYRVCDLSAERGGELLLVLADGMGGERAGAFASQLAVNRFVEAYRDSDGDTLPECLRNALEQANQALAQEIAADPQAYDGMGCTLVAAVLRADSLYWVSVGDSPLWVWRKGHLQRLNQDHSYRQILLDKVAAGEITEEQARAHPYQNALLSAVTGQSMQMVDLADSAYPVRASDRILLASDGLLTLSEEQIATLLTPSTVATPPCQQLLDAVEAAKHSYQDNVTVIVAHTANVTA